MAARHADTVFVHTGAWIALALLADPLHARAVEAWDELLRHGARLATSVAVVLETFTFLDRNSTRDVAIAWKDALDKIRYLRILEGTKSDLASAWSYFERHDEFRPIEPMSERAFDFPNARCRQDANSFPK